MPVFDYYSDDEIQEQIQNSKLDLTQSIDFVLKDAEVKPSKFGGDQLMVVLELWQNGNRYFETREYFSYNATGFKLHRLKQFLRSIGLIRLYENKEEIAPFNLLAEKRTGKLIGEESEYMCKKTETMKIGVAIKDYIPRQETLSEKSLLNKASKGIESSDFDDDIPF